MTARDPALVERLARAYWASSDLDNEEHPEWFAAGLHRGYWLRAAGEVLDLLAAEGRLCEPGEPGEACEHLARLEGLGVELRQARAERDWAVAEVERLRAALRFMAAAPSDPEMTAAEWAVEAYQVATEALGVDEPGLLDGLQDLAPGETLSVPYSDLYEHEDGETPAGTVRFTRLPDPHTGFSVERPVHDR